MKKSILFVLMSLFVFQIVSAKDIVLRDTEKLPQAAKSLIEEYFPNEKISYMKVDEEFLNTTYEVVFTSGNEIEFAENGVWIEIDCKRSEVPPGIIPENIVSYVKQNFPDAFVTQIEKKKFGYEVELSNKLDIDFDKDGNFLRFDD